MSQCQMCGVSDVSPILLPFFWSPQLQQMNGNCNAQDPRDPVAGALAELGAVRKRYTH